MNKITYEAPVTERFSVELEGVFCSSIVIESAYASPGEVAAGNQNVTTPGAPDGWGDFNDNFSDGSWSKVEF